MSPIKIFGSLEGQWHLLRTFRSHSGDYMGKFEGLAQFLRLSGTCFHYKERGTMTLGNNAPVEATKEYFYSFMNDNISVFFDSKLENLYHTVNFSEKTLPLGNHYCSPDTYNTKYHFEGLPANFSHECSVRGPNKDYVILSNYGKTTENGY